MYSPDGESLAGEAGISAGSEGVAIYEKMDREHLKTMNREYLKTQAKHS